MLFVPWLIGSGWYVWHSAAWLTQSSWQEVTASVTNAAVEPVSVQVVKRCNNQDQPHQAVVTYEYEVAGQRYTSKRFDYEHEGDFSCSRASAEASAREYERAGTVTAFYDPARPSEAVLQRPDGVPVYVFGPLLLLAGLAILGLYLWARRRARLTNPFA